MSNQVRVCFKFLWSFQNVQTLIAPSTKDAPNLKGIVTHSSGNHGQAVAYACSQEVANVPCVVVVPKNTPSVKCEAIR